MKMQYSLLLVFVIATSLAESFVTPNIHSNLMKARRLLRKTTKDPPGAEFKDYLMLNKLPNGSIPMSYTVYPINYFDKVPDDKKLHMYNSSYFIVPCGRNASAAEMNAYTFQTEQWLTTLGLNIYDGAVRCIALSLLGEVQECFEYNSQTLAKHKTVQFPDIRGDAPCRGVMEYGQCTDPQQSGVCGFCYGDGPDMSLTSSTAYFFRMIGDYWAIQGTIDQRCPERKMTWTWNDYKPVLGENAWANFIGPAHNAVLRAGSIDKIPDNDPIFALAIPFLTGLKSMKVGNTGAYYYTPRNTWFGFDKDSQNIGSTLSIENQASLLAGLKALSDIITGATSNTYKSYLPQLNTMIGDLSSFVLSAYDPSLGFFRQGATYDPKSGSLTWGQNGAPIFAVDCQTWVSAVLGTKAIDGKYGAGTAYKLWQATKQYARYECPDGSLCGVGYTFRNISGQVLSGEWSYGALNWLNVMIADGGYSSDQVSSLQNDISSINYGLFSYVVGSTPINNSTQSYDSVLYADSRYWIPFGWFANPLPSLASTSWAVFLKAGYNPFRLDGAYKGVLDY